MKFDIRRNSFLPAPILNTDLVTLGDLEGETGKLGKRSDWRDWDETWCEKQANVIDT